MTTEKRLGAALERVRKPARGYNRTDGPLAPVAGPRRDLRASRSTGLGGDVPDFEENQRRVEDRRMAQPDVDRPEPYL